MLFAISLDNEVWILMCIGKMYEDNTHHVLNNSIAIDKRV